LHETWRIAGQHDDGRGVADDSANLLGYFGAGYLPAKIEVRNDDIWIEAVTREL
jgi:hypothetical protein